MVGAEYPLNGDIVPGQHLDSGNFSSSCVLRRVTCEDDLSTLLSLNCTDCQSYNTYEDSAVVGETWCCSCCVTPLDSETALTIVFFFLFFILVVGVIAESLRRPVPTSPWKLTSTTTFGT